MGYLEMADEVNRQIEQYRAALWRWWQLTAVDADADADEVVTVYQTIIVLIDELGPTSADRLRRAWEVDWFKATGRCPRCGLSGERHT